MNTRVSVCLAIVFVCFAAIPALAQNAALVGTIRDSQQALILGAMVTLQNLDTGVELTSTTNELGNYEFPTVRPGNYSLRVELSGFRRFVQNITLAVNERGRIDATLQVGAISAEVTVQETTTVVQTESSALGDVVHSNDGRHRRSVDKQSDVSGDSERHRHLGHQRFRDPRRLHELSLRWDQSERHGPEPDHLPAQHREYSGIQSPNERF